MNTSTAAVQAQQSGQDSARMFWNSMYREVMNGVTEKWMKRLTPLSTLVMIFVTKRTFGRWRLSVPISFHEFMHGITGADGEIEQCGLPAQDQAIQKAVNSLVEMGLLSRKNTHFRHSIRKNVYAIDCKTLLGEEFDMTKLREPRQKRPQKGLVEITKRPQNEGQGLSENHQSCVHNKDQKQTIKTLKPKRVADAPRAGGREVFDTAEEAIAASATRVRRVREARAARAPSSRRPDDIKALWEKCMLRHLPKVPVVGMTMRDYAMVKNALKSNSLTVSMEEFFDYVIVNWSSIRNTKLYWLNKENEKMGAAPSLVFLFRYFKHFLQSMSDELANDGYNAKRAEITEEKRLSFEVEELRRKLAVSDAEKRKLADKVRQSDRIMAEMERKQRQAPEPTQKRLTKAGLAPVEEIEWEPGEWNE